MGLGLGLTPTALPSFCWVGLGRASALASLPGLPCGWKLQSWAGSLCQSRKHSCLLRPSSCTLGPWLAWRPYFLQPGRMGSDRFKFESWLSSFASQIQSLEPSSIYPFLSPLSSENHHRGLAALGKTHNESSAFPVAWCLSNPGLQGVWV